MCLHLDINWCRIWLILLNISSSGFHECRHINTSSFSKCAPASFPFPNESPQEKNQHACDAPEAGFGSSTSLKPEIFNIRSILYTMEPLSYWLQKCVVDRFVCFHCPRWCFTIILHLQLGFQIKLKLVFFFIFKVFESY